MLYFFFSSFPDFLEYFSSLVGWRLGELGWNSLDFRLRVLWFLLNAEVSELLILGEKDWFSLGLPVGDDVADEEQDVDDVAKV